MKTIQQSTARRTASVAPPASGGKTPASIVEETSGHEGPGRTDWVGVVRGLGAAFSDRAGLHDAEGSFVADNYAALRARRAFWAVIPAELGGGGASYGEVAGMIREMARHCGSTALSFAMHTHPVAVNVFKHKRGDQRASAALVRIAERQMVIAGTGANDWLRSSGSAERVDGGYRVTAYKHFVSGSPGADLFVSSAAYEGPDASKVIHFAIPFSSEGVEIVPVWDALGMRGTGSNDVVLRDVFVPDEAVALERPAGGWHDMWNVIIPTALPLITAAYVGLAESAAELAVEAARSKGAAASAAVGEMLNALTVARMALDDMVARNDDHRFSPTLEISDATFTRKALAAEAVTSTVDVAAEIVGGAGFYRAHPIERIVRDVRAMPFHPLPVRKQVEFRGRVALGLDPIG